ncbi:MAG: gamma-glutamylcyclotransferase family protein [Syntrophomonas sp.]
MTKVFVYGSLMTNRHYHQYYLQGKIFLGKGFINEYKRYIIGGGMEGILPNKEEHVQGEVYEVDSATLAKLDFLHNNGTLFNRRIVDVELENGETLQADAYIWNGK